MTPLHIQGNARHTEPTLRLRQPRRLQQVVLSTPAPIIFWEKPLVTDILTNSRQHAAHTASNAAATP
jgi:hypothetical protein